MSDIDNELLDLAGEGTDNDTKSRKRKSSNHSRSKGQSNRKKFKSEAVIDEDETEEEYPMNLSHGAGPSAQREDDDEDLDIDMDVDIDLESEDGYGERRPPPAEASAPTTGRSSPQKSSRSGSEPPAPPRPAPTKRESAPKKPRVVKEKKAPVPKAKAPATKRKPAASKAKKETTEGGGKNPYPLQGKYKDEEDRKKLMALPEIEREEAIAARLEEHQKYLDHQQLADLYSRTNAGQTLASEAVAEDGASEEDMELDMDIDEDSEEELGRGAARTKTVSEPKVKALDKLAEKRKERSERVNNRGSTSKPRQSRDDSDAESIRSEGSEYGARPGTKSRRRERSDGSSDEDDDFVRRRNRKTTQSKRDDGPIDLDSLNAATLSRHDLAEYKHRSFFDAMIKDAFVRCVAGQDERKQPKYRVFHIIGLGPEERRYEMEDRGKSVPENRKLKLQYGKVIKPFRMAEVSNSSFTQSELLRWQATLNADGVSLPFRSDLREKATKLQEYRDKHVTDDDIRTRLDAMQKMGAGPGDKMQEQRLLAEIGLAQRRNDLGVVASLQEQLQEIQAQRSAESRGNGNGNGDLMADMLARVNERSRKVIQDAHKRAFKAETERKRLQFGDFKRNTGYDTPPLDAEKDKLPDRTVNDEARVIETASGDIAVELDLGDF